MQKKHLLIVGGGMSGTKFAAEMVSRTDAYRITIINAEQYAGYNRIMLSPVLAGEKAFADIMMHDDAWYAAHDIHVQTSCVATAIDTDQRQLHTACGQVIAYDQLVLATGSNPLILPLDNHQAQGVVAFRSQNDVESMLAYAQSEHANNCVVIGGGLLGLEAANALAKHGANVTVVHVMPFVLDRQLNPVAAQLLQTHFENNQIHFRLEAFSDKILVNDAGHVTGLLFKDGSSIPADLIVMAVGVRPNITLAKDSGLHCERAIVVDAHMQTSAPDVFAIGECVQFENQVFGLVAPTYAQAQVLANTLLGVHDTFEIQPTATKLKVSGVNLFSAGDITDNADYDYLEYHDQPAVIYKRLSIQNNKIVGAVMYGDVSDGAWIFDLITQQTDITHCRHQLAFGQHYCDLSTTVASI